MDEPTRMKMYQGALRQIPKFSGMKKDRWAYHVHALKIWKSCNNIGAVASPEQQKLAVLTSLTGPAMRAVELHGLGKPTFVNAANMDDYLAVITRVFQPEAESNLARLEFETYRQSADEPISQYGSMKLALYHQSEPNEQARSFAYLRSQMLAGIHSGYVKSEIIRMDPCTQEELLNHMTTVVGRAREAYQLGCGIVPNLDGLASTTRLTSGWNQNQRGRGDEEVPMEIDAVKVMDKRCFKCNKKGHFAKNCRVNTGSGGNRTGGSQGASGSGQGSGGNQGGPKSNINCYYCKKKGHKEADCFKKKKDRQANRLPKGVKTAKDEEEEEWIEIEEENVGKITDFPWGVAQN